MEFRLDRRALTVTTFAEDTQANRQLTYWLSRPAAERLAAVEFMRRQWIGPGTRLQRVLRVTERTKSVEYVVVGPHALAFHGAPRFTGDLDILVRPTEENGERLLRVVADFGFPTTPVTPADIKIGRKVIEMGIPPVQIHVMSMIDGVTWEEIWGGRVMGPFGSGTVAFIGREAFLRNKLAAGRPKDLADIEALREP